MARFLRFVGVILLLGVAVLVGIGIGFKVSGRSRLVLEETPFMVEIQEWPNGMAGGPTLQTRNAVTIAELQMLFPGLTRGYAERPGQRDHTTVSFYHAKESQPRQAVVVVENGEEVWLSGRSRRKPDGNLRLLLQTLPIERVIQLASSQSEPDRNTAVELLKAHRDEYLSTAMEVTRRQNQWMRYKGIRAVEFLMIHGTCCDLPQHVGHPLFVPFTRPSGRSPREQPRVDEVRAWALEMLPAEASGYGSELAALLAAIADQPTIDIIAERLQAATVLREVQVWLGCLSLAHGLPERYRPGGICGNSSHKEKETFRRRELERANEAKTLLLKWHDEHRAEDRAVQLAETVRYWDADLVRKLVNYDWQFERTLGHFGPLLRLGPEVLPTVVEAQRATTDVTKQGHFEFVRAFLTGTADAGLVAKLLAGSAADKRIACDIIAVAQDKSWKDSLAKLLVHPDIDAELATVEQKAAETLVMVHRADALPVLLQASRQGHHTPPIQRAVEIFTVPDAP